MKRALFVALLGIAVASCQKANDALVQVYSPVNVVQLNFMGNDSIDIAGLLKTNSPTLMVTDSFSVTLDPIQGFSYLQVQVKNDSGSLLYQQSFSKIDGNLVGGSFSFSAQNVYVGNLNYTFTPYNNDGTAGNYIGSAVVLYNSATNPPVIDSVVAPDSVQALSSDTTFIDLYAYVHDDYGISDLKSVYFISTKPDGTPANNGNPFPMNGPVILGRDNGSYSLTVELLPLNSPTPPPLGTFTFTFHAVNRSGVLSSPVVHKITVHK